MAKELTITVDATEVLELLHRLGDAADRHVHAASEVTAVRIRTEARARARRATGRLVNAINVREMGPPLLGFQVYVADMADERGRRPDIFPWWHELGTEHMAAQPFMSSAAELEEGPHLRRIAEALQDAIDEEESR